MGRKGWAIGIGVGAALAAWAPARAQGGPPMITDDPGTPGKGKWEVNVAVTGEVTREDDAFQTPLIDANYGLGERLQLKLEGPAEAESSAEDGPRGGLSYVEAGVKWRFLDQGRLGSPVDVSIYPQVEMDRRAAPEWTLPLQVARSFGRFAANVDAGLAWDGRRPSERFYGAAVDFTPESATELIAEVHASTDRAAGGTETLVNLGVRQHVGGRFLVLASAGHSVAEPPGEPGKTVTYLGLSFDTR
jgi:hypothetical protein